MVTRYILYNRPHLIATHSVYNREVQNKTDPTFCVAALQCNVVECEEKTQLFSPETSSTQLAIFIILVVWLALFVLQITLCVIVLQFRQNLYNSEIPWNTAY